MSRLNLTTLILLSAMAIQLVPQTQAADAPTPADSLTAMKDQLAKLKTQQADLESKIAAAEAAVVPAQPHLVTQLDSMPKNLWPSDSDNAIKESLREKWLTENIKPGDPYEFTGSVIVCTPATINEPNKPTTDVVQIVLDCGKYSIWGAEKGIKISAILRNVTPTDAVDWNDKTIITITGKNKGSNLTVNPLLMELESCTKK